MTGCHKSVRALFAALITTLLAVLMHAGAGGSVSVIGTGIVFVIVLWAAMILAGRRLGVVALMAIIGFGQILMHVSMGWFGSAGAALPASATGAEATGAEAIGIAPTMAGMSASEHHMMTRPGSLDLTSAGAVMDHSHAADPAMVAAHVVAIVLTALILKRGEDLVFSVLQLALGPVTIARRAFALARHCLAGEVRILAEVVVRSVSIASAVTGPNYRRGPPALL